MLLLRVGGCFRGDGTPDNGVAQFAHLSQFFRYTGCCNFGQHLHHGLAYVLLYREPIYCSQEIIDSYITKLVVKITEPHGSVFERPTHLRGYLCC